MRAANYKLTELMVVRCAKEINDQEVVFAGVGLPLVVVSFAMFTHAPNMILFTEGGSIRATAPPGLAITVDDPALFCNGDATYGMLSTMAALQRGEVDVGFIGGAQIDKYGNINSTGVGDWTKPETFTYFAGSGGANDMATCSKRVLAIMPQDPKKFVEKVDYLTTPGFLRGAGCAEAPRDDRRRSRCRCQYDGCLQIRPRDLRNVSCGIFPRSVRGQDQGQLLLRVECCP